MRAGVEMALARGGQGKQLFALPDQKAGQDCLAGTIKRYRYTHNYDD